MSQDRKEYMKAYNEIHKEERKAYSKVWYQAHKESEKAKKKEYYEAHREQKKAYRESHREYMKAYMKEYKKSDINAKGETKTYIRQKSQRYLKKYGTKIPDYQIHHCCTYTEPYKFIYCSREIHRLIHAYLRQHNIDADSDHYEQIKHLLDDTVVLYGIE